MGKMLGIKKKDDNDKVDENGLNADEAREREKEQEGERRIVDILNRARRHFICRRVTGNIQIQYAIGAGLQTGSSISCDVTEEDFGSDGEGDGGEGDTWRVSEADQPLPPEDSASYMTKLAYRSMVRLFNKMEWSSEVYAHTSYKENLQICRTVSFNAQVVSLSLSFTAPVSDLLRWGELHRAHDPSAKVDSSNPL
jgi:hypothetical protein